MRMPNKENTILNIIIHWFVQSRTYIIAILITQL